MPLYFAHNPAQFLERGATTRDPLAGGHVCFKGSVRAINKGKAVTHLVYEAYEALAKKEFALLEEEAKRRFSAISVLGVHRLGLVQASEDTVQISASAAHRHEAFLAARFMIDELKKKLPIWKEEHYADGSASWDQGLCDCAMEEDEVLRPVEKAFLAQKIETGFLKKARILLVGAGGLGCPLALNLAALGIANIQLFDGDKVEAKNLARQFIFSPRDIGQGKAALVSAFINERFRSTTLSGESSFLSRERARAIFKNFDLIIDGTDCLKTKVFAAEEARIAKVPFICASVFHDEGEVVFIHPESSSGCFSCFRRSIEEAHSCETSGVYTHSCATVAACASAQALLILAKKNALQSSICLLNSLGLSRTIVLSKDPHCLKCQNIAPNLLRVKR